MSPPFKKRVKIDGWYEKKSYPHFDLPLNYQNAAILVDEFQKNPTHSFYPFLAYEKKSRKFKGRNNISEKKRPIKYAAHKDGYIYSFFSKQITADYETRIKSLGIERYVIAYRAGLGNNVDFAKDAFDEIHRRGTCVAIALDISGFFDNIDHANLKKEWCATINKTILPQDHFSIFKALTNWSEIDRDACYERLKAHYPEFNIKRPPHPLCNEVDFRKILRGRKSEGKTLIKKNVDKNGILKNYGIPQGTPLSALLSNLYMVPFDCAMKKLAEEIGGYYRRYSDDIIWICDSNYKEKVLQAVDVNLKYRGPKLTRKEDKKSISIFKKSLDGEFTCDRPFQYLGFTYDGKKILLRSQTLAKYWRRLIYATKRVKMRARKRGSEKFLRKKINLSLTHLGKGNFVRGYAYKAQKKMGGKAIKKQLSGHLERINEELK